MFNDIIRPIGLVQLIADALGMICMPYLIVVVSLRKLYPHVLSPSYICVK